MHTPKCCGYPTWGVTENEGFTWNRLKHWAHDIAMLGSGSIRQNLRITGAKHVGNEGVIHSNNHQ